MTAHAVTTSAGVRHCVGFEGSIPAWYVENESGAKLARPELFRLLADAHDGDILQVEQVDRLSRLTAADWEKLKAELTARHIRVVALDLPTSWTVAAKATDEFTSRMFEAIKPPHEHARRVKFVQGNTGPGRHGMVDATRHVVSTRHDASRPLSAWRKAPAE
jgi:hypothetical protein